LRLCLQQRFDDAPSISLRNGIPARWLRLKRELLVAAATKTFNIDLEILNTPMDSFNWQLICWARTAQQGSVEAATPLRASHCAAHMWQKDRMKGTAQPAAILHAEWQQAGRCLSIICTHC